MQEVTDSESPNYKWIPFLKKYLAHLIVVFVVLIGSIVWISNYAFKQESPKSKAAETAGRTWIVCPRLFEGCNFYGPNGIQNAVNTAQNGDTIFLKTGEYAPPDIINIDSKSINILGEGPDNSIISGQINSNAIFSISHSTGVSISKLRIHNHPDPRSARVNTGIRISNFSTNISLSQLSIEDNYLGVDIDGLHGANSVIIKGNIIKNNKVGVGLIVHPNTPPSNNIISNNIFLNNFYSGITIGDANIGIHTITNNTFFNNGIDTVNPGNQVQLSSVNNLIFKNNVVDNGTSRGIKTDHFSQLNNFSYNDIFNNRQGNYIGDIGDQTGHNSNISQILSFIDPNNPTSPNFHLQASSPAKNTGDPTILDPDGSRSDMGAYGGPDACLLDSTLPGCTTPTSVPSPTSNPSPTSSCLPVSMPQSIGPVGNISPGQRTIVWDNHVPNAVRYSLRINDLSDSDMHIHNNSGGDCVPDHEDYCYDYYGAPGNRNDEIYTFQEGHRYDVSVQAINNCRQMSDAKIVRVTVSGTAPTPTPLYISPTPAGTGVTVRGKVIDVSAVFPLPTPQPQSCSPSLQGSNISSVRLTMGNLQNPQPPETFTNAQGEFEFRNVQPGTYHLCSQQPQKSGNYMQLYCKYNPQNQQYQTATLCIYPDLTVTNQAVEGVRFYFR